MCKIDNPRLSHDRDGGGVCQLKTNFQLQLKQFIIFVVFFFFCNLQYIIRINRRTYRLNLYNIHTHDVHTRSRARIYILYYTYVFVTRANNIVIIIIIILHDICMLCLMCYRRMTRGDRAYKYILSYYTNAQMSLIIL